ncbi:hypothetical protein AWC22_23055 [Mycobacterium riyadhense]|uniref:Uncharacterized protein n=1 Tax=Mycobacterium riyadhense TaxID=486698 RepID=A0A1X2CFL1_9MYCO|nr:hypothetical protein AWC22_23055 [Mycobacterium riyadhense]
MIDEIAVIAEALAEKGKSRAHLGVTHWSSRLIGGTAGDLVRLGGTDLAQMGHPAASERNVQNSALIQ